MKSGVYKITNILNNKIYIGSSINIKSRWSKHISDLDRNKHPNKHLQHSYNKYGKNKFIFSIELLCLPKYLLEYEQFYLDSLQPDYNYYKVAGSPRGRIVTEETRRKLSIANTGKKLAEKDRVRMQTVNIGRKRSKETKDKISIAAKCRSVSLETRKRMSESFSKRTYPSLRKTVYQIDVVTNTILNTFSCAEEGANQLGIGLSNIRSNLGGYSKSAGGFLWKYSTVQQ